MASDSLGRANKHRLHFSLVTGRGYENWSSNRSAWVGNSNTDSNYPIQDYVHPDNQTQPTFQMTPEFKPFTKQIQLNLFTTATLQNSKKVYVIESFKQESTYIVWIICPLGKKDGRCKEVTGISKSLIDKYI